MGMFADSLNIYKREMLIFKSNLRVNLIRSMMFPLIIIIFFGSIGNSLTNVPIAVVNYANNQQSLSFINALEARSTLSVVSVTDQATAMNLLYTTEVSAVVVILPIFPSTGTASSVDLYYSSTEASTAAAVVPFVESAAEPFGAHVSTLNQELNSGGNNFVSTIPTTGASSSYEDFLVAGVIVMASAFGAVFSSGFSVILDRQLGNMKSFLITPINKNSIILGKLMAGTTQSTLYGFVALLLGIVLGAHIAMGIAGLPYIALMIVLISLAFTAIALMIASRLKAVEVYAIVAQIVVLPAWVVSGAFTPVSVFPAWLQAVSAVDPLTYATSALRQVMLAGYIIPSQIVVDVVVLAIFSLGVSLLAFAIFKSTIE